MGNQTSISSSARSFWAAGCLLLIIVGVAMFFFRQDTHPTVLAFRLALVAVGLVGLVIITLASRKSGPEPRSIAREILHQQKSIYSAPHEFIPASVDDFEDVDRAFYDQMQRELESEGFRLVEDVENTTMSQAFPAFRTFVRTMVGDDDSTVARIYQMQPAGRAGRDFRTLELTTEFSDFTFTSTTNAQLFLDAAETHGIRTHRCAADMPANEMLRNHREAVAQVRAKNATVQVVRCRSLQDVLKSARHAHAVRSVHRKRSGYVTEDDLKVIRGEPLTELDRRIFEEINQLESQERGGESAA